SHGTVIVESVALMGVAADHVGRLEHRAGYGIVDAAALAGDLGPRHVHDLFLRVIHHDHAFGHALGHYRARHQRTVQIIGFDPVIILDPDFLRIGLADPDNGAAARQRQHQEV